MSEETELDRVSMRIDWVKELTFEKREVKKWSRVSENCGGKYR